MARTRFRDLVLAPLLMLFAGSITAAPPISPRTIEDVRTAIDRGQWSAAEAKAAAALRVAGTDDDGVWELRVRRGEALSAMARYDEARAMLQPELPPRLAHGKIAVRRLLALGVLSFYVNDVKAAIPAIEEAQRIAEADQPSLLPNALFYRSFFDRAQADALLRRGLQLAKKDGNRWVELYILLRNARDRVFSGRHYVEAIRSYESLLKRARDAHYDGLEAKVEGELGWAFREIGDFERSTPHLERAAAITEKTGAILDRLTFIVNLGNNAFDRGDLATAERFYRVAYAQGKTVQFRQLGFVLHNLAEVALESGRFAEARQLAAEAEAFKKSIKDNESLLLTRLLDSRIATETNEYETARKIAEEVSSQTSRDATRWQAQLQLGIVYAAQKRTADADQQFRSALATLQSARAAINDEALRLSFNNEAADVLGRYIDFLVANGRAEEALRAVESVQGQTLEEGLGVKPNRDPKTIAKQTRATILCYHLGRKTSYVWTITPEAIRVATLPSVGVIYSAIDAYVRDLLGPAGSNDNRGISLYRMLVEPAGVRGGRVIVIPDERLNVLNFEALVVPGPKAHYWIEDVVLSNAPSLQLLGREAPAAKGADSLLLIGNAPQADPAYPALPKAADEVEAVRKQFRNAALFTGPKATPAAYREALPQKFDIVHFVAHGEATIANPFESAVILGRDASGYKLFAADIIRQPITARLVTVSSCYGAGRRTYAGEGLVGLAWAFLRAGAQQVIAAVWNVDDSATPKLMNELYANLRAGRDPATALRDAKLSLVRSKGIHAKPRFWAPFVIYSGM